MVPNKKKNFQDGIEKSPGKNASVGSQPGARRWMLQEEWLQEEKVKHRNLFDHMEGHFKDLNGQFGDNLLTSKYKTARMKDIIRGKGRRTMS
jgi:hypothetical protein